MKIDPYYISGRNVVSSGIRFMRIFAEIPWGGGQMTVRLSRTAIFSVFTGYFFWKLER